MDEDREITAPIDTEALQAGWDAKAGAIPKVQAVLRIGAKTDLGQVRENNEDKFDFIEPDDPGVLAGKGAVYAVADGMGGHSAGQIASELGLKIFIRTYYADTSGDVEASLTRAVREANAYLVNVAGAIPGRGGMGTTLTAAVVREDNLFIAQVGDSRLYLLRDGTLRQITEDHSWVAEHVRRGTMTAEEAEHHPHRNVITRSLGGAPDVEPDIFALRMEVGDRYLLCSDGLSGMVSDEELLRVGSLHSPSVAAWNLVELANENGGKDNITALLIDVREIRPWEAAAPESADSAAPERAPAPASLRLTGPPEGRGVGPEGSPGDIPEGAPSGGERPGSGMLGRLFGRGRG